MPNEIASAAIQRGLASLAPGGQLDVSFFGGEPLIEAQRIRHWMNESREMAAASGARIRFNMTTNGTMTHEPAWQVLMEDDLDLAVSFDGTPAVHDLHRRDVQGSGTARLVEQTMQRLLRAGKEFIVVVVVRPDTLEAMPAGLIFLHELGIRHVELSLDLWARWNVGDGKRLEAAVEQAAELWCGWLPNFAIGWFDGKVRDLARLPVVEENTRCGFGNGEIAVAPSGNLYPCERLIGGDTPDQPLRLPGHVLEGKDFLSFAPDSFEACDSCSSCALSSACDTRCRCSNFVRTGDLNRPDGLLCLVNKAAARAVSNVAGEVTLN